MFGRQYVSTGWKDYDPPLADAPLFFVVAFAASIVPKVREWLAGDEALKSPSRITDHKWSSSFRISCGTPRKISATSIFATTSAKNATPLRAGRA